MTSLTGNFGPTGQKQMQNRTGGNIVPKGYELGKIQQYTPEQQNLYQSLFSHLSPDSFTSRLAAGDEDIFNQIERPAFRQFNELQGGLASRFARGGGQGSLGSRRSSGYQNASTAANQSFAEQLQANRQGLQSKALQDLMSMSHTLLGERPAETDLFQKPQRQNTFLEQLALSLSGGVGQGIGQIGSSFLGKLIPGLS